MTNKEKKEYLKRYDTLNQEINRTLAECEEWRSKAEKMTASYSFTPKSQSQESRHEKAIEHILELEDKMDEDVDRLVELRKEIELSISSLPDNLRLILKHKYIDGMTWSKVCYTMYHEKDDFIDKFDSYLRDLYRKHGKALTLLSLNVTIKV